MGKSVIFYKILFYPTEQPPFLKFDYMMEALRNLGIDVFSLVIRHGKVNLWHDHD